MSKGENAYSTCRDFAGNPDTRLVCPDNLINQFRGSRLSNQIAAHLIVGLTNLVNLI